MPKPYPIRGQHGKRTRRRPRWFIVRRPFFFGFPPFFDFNSHYARDESLENNAHSSIVLKWPCLRHASRRSPWPKQRSTLRRARRARNAARQTLSLRAKWRRAQSMGAMNIKDVVGCAGQHRRTHDPSVAAVALSYFVGRNHSRVGPGLAVQACHSGCPVHAGRLHRPARAHCCAGLGAADRQAVCGRETGPARASKSG